jgi:protein-L-isoaspartate(D-aspartate) O-methyltransferase
LGPPAVDPFGFVGQRRRLIESIRASGVEDLEVLRLFDQVPRHVFLPDAMRAHAYEDAAIPIGYAQTASQPSLQAAYLAAARPGPEDSVLEVGTGSGYLTALFAKAAGRVYSVERVRELSARARKALDTLDLRNVALHVGDGSIGWRKFAPYDIIVISAASPSVPPALLDQLADGGRLLIPIGPREVQRLVLFRKSGNATSEEEICEQCVFVPLLGRHGWTEKEA